MWGNYKSEKKFEKWTYPDFTFESQLESKPRRKGFSDAESVKLSAIIFLDERWCRVRCALSSAQWIELLNLGTRLTKAIYGYKQQWIYRCLLRISTFFHVHTLQYDFATPPRYLTRKQKARQGYKVSDNWVRPKSRNTFNCGTRGQEMFRVVWPTGKLLCKT